MKFGLQAKKDIKMKNQPYIINKDRVKIINQNSKFFNKSGYVTRVSGGQACVVIKNVWSHGIWIDLNDLKRTKRYNK